MLTYCKDRVSRHRVTEMESLARSPLTLFKSSFCLADAAPHTSPSPAAAEGLPAEDVPRDILMAQSCCLQSDRGLSSQGPVRLATGQGFSKAKSPPWFPTWPHPVLCGTGDVPCEQSPAQVLGSSGCPGVYAVTRDGPVCQGSVLCQLPPNTPGCDTGKRKGQGPNAPSSIHWHWAKIKMYFYTPLENVCDRGNLGFGTSGHGLVGMVVLGWWLDFMILEVCSNLNDSMTLKAAPCPSPPLDPAPGPTRSQKSQRGSCSVSPSARAVSSFSAWPRLRVVTWSQVSRRAGLRPTSCRRRESL